MCSQLSFYILSISAFKRRSESAQQSIYQCLILNSFLLPQMKGRKRCEAVKGWCWLSLIVSSHGTGNQFQSAGSKRRFILARLEFYQPFSTSAGEKTYLEDGKDLAAINIDILFLLELRDHLTRNGETSARATSHTKYAQVGSALLFSISLCVSMIVADAVLNETIRLQESMRKDELQNLKYFICSIDMWTTSKRFSVLGPQLPGCVLI